MIVNETKHQALILGKTEHKFCLPVNDAIDIFGMTIDNKLSFDKHVSVICKKINNQFNVMLRFGKLINKETYSSSIKPLFCHTFITVLLFGTSVMRAILTKSDNLNKRILRFLSQDYSCPYAILLSKVNLTSLFIRRLQDFMMILYKSLFFTYYPVYLRDMLTVRTSSYNLRGNYILDLPKANTTTYGLHSFSYLASQIWNSLPNAYRTSDFLQTKDP